MLKKFTVVFSLLNLAIFSSHAEDKLETSGYIDISFSNTEQGDNEASNLSLDNFHLNFDYKLSDKLKVSAHIKGNSDEDFELEQAHLVFSVNENLSIMAGKFLSAQGFEAFHSPDLFQYSYSATLVYPAMMNAVAVKYTQDNYSLYGAVMSSAWDSTDTDTENSAFETALKITSIPNTTIHVGFVSEENNAGFTQTLANIWASHSIDKLLLAVEYNKVSDWFGVGNDGDGWLVMANYAFDEKLALTLRTSELNIDNGASSITKNAKWTISPSYKIYDYWTILAEYNVVDDQIANQDTNTFAIESIITF